MTENKPLTLEQIEAGIQSGTLEMTPACMREVLSYFSGGPKWGEVLNDNFDDAVRWASLADETWIDMLIEVILPCSPAECSPAESSQAEPSQAEPSQAEPSQAQEYHLNDFVDSFLWDIVVRFPDHGYAALMNIADETDRHCPVFLRSLGATRKRRALIYLAKLGEQVESLSVEQIEALLDGIGTIGLMRDELTPQALELLSDLRNRAQDKLDNSSLWSTNYTLSKLRAISESRR